jgi:hypothetical protein
LDAFGKFRTIADIPAIAVRIEKNTPARPAHLSRSAKVTTAPNIGIPTTIINNMKIESDI